MSDLSKLNEIEQRARASYEVGLEVGEGTALVSVIARDVLALVGIAKAARELNERAKVDLPEWYPDDGFESEEYDYFIRLDAALERLDSPASEDT